MPNYSTPLTQACDGMHTARRKALAVRGLAAMTGHRLTDTALGRAIVRKAEVAIPQEHRSLRLGARDSDRG